MKYFFSVYSIISLLILFDSCSNSTSYKKDNIYISKNNSKLYITNLNDNTIYYFIVEQNTAASINWAPSNKAVNILSGNTVVIKYNEIFGVKNEAAQQNTKVIFYYWKASKSNSFDIKSVVINL